MNPESPILVTGGTGFAGSHLIEHLLESGSTNVHTTSFGGSPAFMQRLLSPDRIHQLDLTDFQAVTALLKELQPSQIYHLAAFAYVGKSFEKSSELFQNNIKLQENLLKAVLDHSPQSRVLIVGSAEEYGVSQPDELPMTEDHPFRPINPYAVSKITQDLLAYAYFLSYHLNIVRVRPFNHIGERQSDEFVVSSFAKQIALIERGQQAHLAVGNLEATRDFTDVKDIVAGYQLLMERGESGEVYNLGSGQGTTIQAVVDQLVDRARVPITLEPDPTRLRPNDLPIMIADSSKARALGWQPVIPLADSLERVLEFWRDIL